MNDPSDQVPFEVIVDGSWMHKAYFYLLRIGSEISVKETRCCHILVYKMSNVFRTFVNRLCEVIFERSLTCKLAITGAFILQLNDELVKSLKLVKTKNVL